MRDAARAIAIVLSFVALGGAPDATWVDTAPSSIQCAARPDSTVIGSPDVAPVPLGSNALPQYSPLLMQAGISDTLVVRFTVGTEGMIEPSSYCVERPGKWDSLGHAEIRTWRFEPARRNGSAVPAAYRLEIVYSARDTVRGPMEGARLLSEVDHPGLHGPRPRLTLGPMRRTFGLPKLSPALELEERVERALVRQILSMAELDSIPICMRDAPDAFRGWDRAAGAAEPDTRSRCAVGQTTPVAEVWIQRSHPRAGWFGRGLFRVPARVRTFDNSRCLPTHMLCGGGTIWRFDCEGLISGDRVSVQCALEELMSYVH